MKKIFTLILGITLAYSCSTSSDGNGNSNTTVVPVAPSNLTGTIVSDTQINLLWTDNSTNETGFKVERRIGSGTYSVVGTTAADFYTFNDVGLISNTTYTYRVYAYNLEGNSLTYSNEFTTTTSNNSVTDIDGNIYQTVTICNQVWTKSNLNASKYSDGTLIPQVTDPTAWAALTTGAWCYNNNDAANGAVYGKLYNWYALAGIYNTASASNISLRKKLAPTGYHTPTDAEWTMLTNNCLGAIGIAGGKMKATGTIQASTGLWQDPNTAATNESGFTGLPGGYRVNTGAFNGIGTNGSWWSSSENSTSNAWLLNLKDNFGSAGRYNASKGYGYSVRCIRD